MCLFRILTLSCVKSGPSVQLKNGHVIPQYYIAYDNDFYTVEYIYSGEDPPNQCKLVQDLSEQVSDDQYDMARTWYTGKVNDKHE